MNRTLKFRHGWITGFLIGLAGLLCSALNAFAQVPESQPAISPRPVIQPSPVIPARPAETDSLGEKQKSFQKTIKAIGIKDADAAKLSAANIATFSELRKGGDLTKVRGLENLSKADVARLTLAATLSLLSRNEDLNVALNKMLEKKGVRSVRDLDRLLAKVPKDKLSETFLGKLTEPEAERYRNRVHALKNLTDAHTGRKAALAKMPPPLLAQPKKEGGSGATGSPPGSPPTPPSAGTTSSASAALETNPCTYKCDESTSLFSPAVYLLYLVDFTKKSFGPMLDSLDKINRRFQQKLEGLSISQDLSEQNSYVQYTNEVLENLIATLDNQPWPNERIPEIQKATRRQPIYQTFWPIPTASGAYPYHQESGVNARVLVELFDAHVKELGTSRKEVQFILKGTAELAGKFAAERDVEITDLQTINRDDEQISTIDVEKMKVVLFRSFTKQAERAVRRECDAETEEATRRRFNKLYTQYREAQTDQLLQSLIPVGPKPTAAPATTQYDANLFKLKGAARQCVELGQSCPSTSPFKDSPINPLQELFRLFADKYEGYTAGTNPKDFATARLDSLRAGLTKQTYKDLVATEPFGSFVIDVLFAGVLDGGQMTQSLRTEFAAKGRTLSPSVELTIKEIGQSWEVWDQGPREPYFLRKEGDKISVYYGSDALSQKASRRAAERLRSEEELDAQIQRLAKRLVEMDLRNAEVKDDFDFEVKTRTQELYRSALSKAQAGLLKQIRSNLLAVALVKLDTSFARLSLAEPPFPLERMTINGRLTVVNRTNVDRLADYLHMDLSVDETSKTTPLAVAILRLQSFVTAAQMGREKGIGPPSGVTWPWLRSYGIWHAAMMVSLYPENFLFPELRQSKTPQFEAWSKQEWDKPESGVNQYLNEVNKLRGIGILNALSRPDKVFIFGRPPGQRQLYYSVLKADGKWRGWDAIPGAIVKQGFIRLATFEWNGSVHLVGLFSSSGGPASISNSFEMKHMALPITGDRLGAAGNDASQGGPSQTAEDAWERVGESVAISAAQGLYFACESPLVITGLEGEGSLDCVLIGKLQKRIIYRRISIAPDGTLQTSEESPFSSLASFLLVYNNVDAVNQIRGVKGIQGGSGPFLWNYAGSLYLSRDHLGINDSSKLPNTPPTVESYGAVGSPEEFLFFYTTPADSQVNVARYRVQTGSTVSSVQSMWSGVLPEGKSLGMAIATLGYDFIVFLRPVDVSHGWKSYYWSFYSGRSNLSLPTSGIIGNPGTPAKNFFNLMAAEDQARVYLEESYLHVPMHVAGKLRDEGKFEAAAGWLRKVYDPFRSVESERRVYPDFTTGGAGVSASNTIGRWLVDPFNPYALADLRKESYLLRAKLVHVENFVDWSDRVFLQDTSESVNRARELYELAEKTLEMHEWPRDDCELEWHRFRGAPEVFTSTSAAAVPRFTERAEAILSRPACDIVNLAGVRRLGATSSTLLPFGALLARDEAAVTDDAGEAEVLAALSEETMDGLGAVTIGEEIPELKPFCLPLNPMVNVLRWRIVSNLEKIRTNRNFAGIQRQLQPYATPVDPQKLVKAAASGGLDFDESIPSTPPPIHRYSFLVERAKYLISVAQQLEGSMLASIEKEDESTYSLMRAKQDVRLERANVTLQTLRMKESGDSLKLAEKQKERAQLSLEHFDGLLAGDMSSLETVALTMMWYSIALPSGVTTGAASSGVTYSPSGMLQTMSNVFGTLASYERRRQEWEYQRGLSDHDVAISEIGINLARDRIDIVSQEKEISQSRLEFANDVVEFLGNKFTNRDLYQWMLKNLHKLYREQLNMAIATAKAAQRALEFERQTSLEFIGYDYWDSEKKGLLGAERLQKDLNKMEQYRLSTATRKREIERTISLASVAPAEFQRFRQTGVLEFTTLNQWFDRDFPGHYMRLIRDISVTTLALVPPTESIQATLSHSGVSRIMAGPPFEKPAVVYRLPESVALTSTSKATGLFELRPDDPMLFPFEGNGVEASWRLEMPKGANRFDYNTILDVYLTIRYTAFEDRSYRDKVLTAMGQDEDGYVKTLGARYFSLKRDFPDQWYLLHHSAQATDQGQQPYRMEIELKSFDFLPNEDGRSIKKVMIAAQKSERPEWTSISGYQDAGIPLTIEFKPDKAGTAILKNLMVAGSHASSEDFNGLRPYGKWMIGLDTSDTSHPLIFPVPPPTGTPQTTWLDDILIVVEYQAKIRYNR